MKLSDYLSANGLTLAAFAAKSGLSVPTVSRLRRGLNRPDWKTLDAINEATDGQVTANDFYGQTNTPEAA
jgi:transcriptional regulator with XRE-family HTH domain